MGNLPPHPAKRRPLDVPPNAVEIGPSVGNGEFGDVCAVSVTAWPRCAPVPSFDLVAKCTKALAAAEDQRQLKDEAAILWQFSRDGHPNLPLLVGVCWNSRPCWILMQKADCDLLRFLSEAGGRDPTSAGTITDVDQLFHLVTQIAAGVEALAERYAVIHRDLACRNCLVHYAGAQGPRVVISDFGMAKRVRRNQRYTDKQYRALVPLRWMAPESALAGVYSRASDVYSLGVVLWEVFASGRRPYDSLAGAEVYDALTRGRTLQCENNWPLRFRSLLGRMWAPQPGGRPPARDVHAELRLMAQDLASTTDRKGGRAHEAVAHVSIL